MASADIVIVNWNSGELLRECLESIVEFGEGAGRVIVIDNGSTDGSPDVAFAGLDLEVVRAGANLGFAKACNFGANRCSSSYILFLNPDARLVADGLGRAIAFMEGEAAGRVGICGVRLTGEDGRVHRHCARFPTLLTYVGGATGLDRLLPRVFKPHFMEEFDHLTSRPVDEVIGAFFLVRRSLFEELGGLDERFFVYFEELDFCLRAARRGWQTYYLAEAAAYHKGNASTDQVRAHRLFYSMRSRLLYAFKHFSAPAAWSVVAVTCIFEPVSRLVRAVFKGDVADTAKGYRMLLGELRDILARARARPGETVSGREQRVP